jgi:hypothetical protein
LQTGYRTRTGNYPKRRYSHRNWHRSLTSSICNLEEARLSNPGELLARYGELVPWLGLDGVRRLHAGDRTCRHREINEYYAVIEAALKEHSLEEVRDDTITVPEELRILSELGVDGLIGAGLGIRRSWHQVAF